MDDETLTMTQDKKPRPQPQEAEEAAPAEAAAEPEAEQQRSEEDPVAALQAENAELRDRLLRAVAEMDNTRKRAEREVRDAAQYAISSFARDVLGVGDNMRRAFESVGEEARKREDAVLRGLLDGIEMTERELLNTLERHGVCKIEPKGEKFDPHLHQAMLEVEDKNVPAGTVVQVMQAGFTINGRVLRPAMVAVSKGGPKPGAEQVGDEAAPAQGGASAAGETAPADAGEGAARPRVDRRA